MRHIRVKNYFAVFRKFVDALYVKRRKLTKTSESAVSHLKDLIGERIRESRGKVSQDALESMSGVDRGIIGAIENASRDYRIDSLLAVIVALNADEKIVFDKDPLTAKLAEELLYVLQHGHSDDIQLVMLAIRNALRSAQHKSKKSA